MGVRCTSDDSYSSPHSVPAHLSHGHEQLAVCDVCPYPLDGLHHADVFIARKYPSRDKARPSMTCYIVQSLSTLGVKSKQSVKQRHCPGEQAPHVMCACR